MPKKSRLPASVTLMETIQILGISRQAVATHVAAGLIEKVGHDAYSLSGITRYIGHLRRLASSSGGGAGLSAAREALTQAKARRAEIELGVLRAQFLPVGEFEKGLTFALSAVKSRLLAIPSKVAMRIRQCNSEVGAQALMRREVEAALLALGQLEFKTEDEESNGDN